MAHDSKYQVEVGGQARTRSMHIGDINNYKSGSPNRPSRSPGRSGIDISRLRFFIDTDAALDRTKYIIQWLESDREKHDLPYILKQEINQIDQMWRTALAGFVKIDESSSMLKLLEKCVKNCCYQLNDPDKDTKLVEFEGDIKEMQKILMAMYSTTYSNLMGKRI
jgi:hypothetical protein